MIYAQKADITISAYTFDELNEKALKGVHAALLTADSAVVDTFKLLVVLGGAERYYLHTIELKDAAVPASYIARFERRGYATTYLPVNVSADDIKKGEFEVNLGAVKMPRAYTRLKEASVTASKIMMVMKGDTMVYNADALASPPSGCTRES